MLGALPIGKPTGFCGRNTKAQPQTLQSGIDCNCRAYGRIFELGDIICMRRPSLDYPMSMEKVQCDFVLNNTAWKPINEKCDPLS
jgi:hypothetical protein